eukprot:11915126-Karenia_brevis.AAC.1
MGSRSHHQGKIWWSIYKHSGYVLHYNQDGSIEHRGHGSEKGIQQCNYWQCHHRLYSGEGGKWKDKDAPGMKQSCNRDTCGHVAGYQAWTCSNYAQMSS